jgi:hypothetical protein
LPAVVIRRVARRVLSPFLLTAALLSAASQEAPANTVAGMSSGIVLDAEGTLYFADDRHETVWRVNLDTGELSPAVEGVRSFKLAIDDDGNLYGEDIRYDRVEDKYTSRLWKADRKGKVKDLYGPKPGLPPGLLLDAEGNRYWNVRSVAPEPNSRIIKQSPDGELTTLVGGKWGLKDGEGEKAEVGGVYDMIWGPRDRIYFTDGNALRYLTPTHWVSTVTRFPSVEPTKSLPEPTVLWGLTVDKEGTIHVAHYTARRVERVWQTGGKKVVVQLDAPWFPTGVTTRGIKLYVLVHGIELPNKRVGPRVLEWDPKGVLRVVADTDAQTAAN